MSAGGEKGSDGVGGEDLGAWSIGKLKGVLAAAGVGYAGCNPKP